MAKLYFHNSRPNGACTYGGGNKNKLKVCGNPGSSNWNDHKVCGTHYIKCERRTKR